MKKPRKAKKARRVKPVPAGYHSVTPYLACGDAARAIDFYKKAFGATEVMRMPGPDGKIGHAEVKIGDSRVMLTDEYREMDFLSPMTRGGTTVHIHLYVADADKMAERAVGAGGRSWCTRCRTSSTATAPARSGTRSATSGTSPPTPRTSRWLSCASAARRR